MIEDFGADIEYDLMKEGVDLLDFFRGKRPWRQLLRWLPKLPEDGWYKSALAMDEEIGRMRADQPIPDEIPPPSPLGYSLPVLLQLKQIDLLKELMRAFAAGMGGKLPPPIPHEPRPQTAEQRIREQRDIETVADALRRMGFL